MPRPKGVETLIEEFKSQNRLLVDNGKINPLDDGVFLALAKYTEEGDNFWSIKRIVIDQNCKLNIEDTRSIVDAEECRVRIKSSQEDDLDYLLKLKRKYGKKFPKTFEKIDQSRKVATLV